MLEHKDANRGENLCLSLLLGDETIQFAVFSNNFKEVNEIGEETLETQSSGYVDAVMRFVQNHRFNYVKFVKVNILLLNKDFTLLPKSYASVSDTNSAAIFAIGANNETTILSHVVNDIKFFYCLRHELLNYLEKTFTNCSIRHSGAVALNLLFNNHSLLNTDVFLNIGKGSVEMAARNAKTILFYNVFDFETNEDILYYLLFIMEQNGLNPSSVRLRIAAQKPADDEIIKTLKRYVREVDLCVHDKSIQLTGELLRQPSHYFFPLLNQHLCEL
jgi:hypothetical protein